MANQVIIANSKEVFKDQTYNTLNPMSSGVVLGNINVPEAVTLEATGVSWGHYTITQQILRLLMRNKAPLEVFRPDYSHKEIGTVRNSPVSAGSTAAGSPNVAKTIDLAAQSTIGGATNAMIGQRIFVGNVLCYVSAVTVGSPSTITVIPVVSGQTVPATTAGTVMGWVDTIAQIGQQSFDMKTPELSYYTFQNYLQTLITPIVNTNRMGALQQDRTEIPQLFEALPNTYTSGWISTLSGRGIIPQGSEYGALYVTKAFKIAVIDHSLNKCNAMLLSEPTTNAVVNTTTGNPTFTMKGLLPSINEYGSQHSYVGSTGMTQSLFQSINAEAIYYGYEAKDYMMFMPAQMRYDFQNFISAFTTSFNVQNVDTSGFDPETAQYVNMTFSGIQLDGINYWMHRKFDILQYSGMQASKYANKGFFIPYIERTPRGETTQIIQEVVPSSSTSDFGANTGAMTPGSEYSGGVWVNSIGSNYASQGKISTTLADTVQELLVEDCGLLLKHIYTCGFITRT